MSIRFTQSCPTCGRRAQVPAALLGRTVVCQHCNAEFVASREIADSHRADAPQSTPSDPLMERVEKALSQVSDSSSSV